MLALALLTLATVATQAQAQATLDTTLWVTNANVETIARSGDTVYLGGRFTEVGPPTGAGVAVQYPGGAVVAGFPKVTGFVYASAPDGEGGWYIGGSFNAVAGIPRANAAHIRSDNTVSAWNPNVTSGGANRVNSILVQGGRVFLAGFFATAGGQPRNSVAAVDRETGLATPWNPNANSEVLCLAVNGATIVAAGRFASIGGQTRGNIAQLDTTAGLATAWNPNASQQVEGLVVHGSTVYAWGEFVQIGGQTRPLLAALDAGSGLATSFNPRPLSEVHALVVNAGVVYLGGDFTDFFSGAPRNRLAAVDSATGFVRPWNPNAGGGLVVGNPSVNALCLHGTELLVGGNFTSIGGQPRSYLAAVDTATGLAAAWDPHAGGQVLTLASDASTVFAGGFFLSMNGVGRNRIAAFDVTTGAATAFNPNSNGIVRALAVRGDRVYALGDFTNIGGASRARIAELDAATGIATTWNAQAQVQGSATLWDLATTPSAVFVAGDVVFNSIGGKARTDLAAIDRATALAFPWWDPRPSDAFSNAVRRLATGGSRLYIGGSFGYVGGLPRTNLAALDTLTGQADFTWDAAANNQVFALGATPTGIYAGGIFTSIGGESRNGIAELDPVTAHATAWNPNILGPVLDLGVGDGFVCAVGQLSNVGGVPAIGNAVALDATTGQSLGWSPVATYGNLELVTVDVAGSDVYLGGTFSALDGRPVGNIAAYRFESQKVDVPRAGPSGTPIVRAWPNPFVQGVAVAFDLPVAQEVRLEVHDVAGRRVWDSELRRMGAGPQILTWDGRASAEAGGRLATGVYFVRVAGTDYSATCRLVRL